MQYFYLQLQLLLRLVHSKLDSLEAKGNHLADTSARNAILKGTKNSQTGLMVQRVISPNYNLGKLDKEDPQLASEKEKQD